MKSQGFTKAQRLRSKKDFETLIYRGNSFIEFPLKFIWSSHIQTETTISLAISAPKKRFKHAVDRNRIKRLVRESFRKLSPEFSAILNEKNKKIALLIVYIANEHSSQIKIHKTLEKGLREIVETHENS